MLHDLRLSEWGHNCLKNECLFFWAHGEWIVAQDKQTAWTAKQFSGDLFVLRSHSFPMNPEKKTLIPYYHKFTMFPPKILSEIIREKL